MTPFCSTSFSIFIALYFIFPAINGCSWSSKGNSSQDAGEDGVHLSSGFGKIGPHGESKISSLSVVAGYAAYGNTLIYTSTGGTPFIIDLEKETERRIDSPFFMHLLVCQPSIWKNIVVFGALENDGDPDLFSGVAVWDLEREEGIFLRGSSSEDRKYPKVHNNRIVWQDARFYNIPSLDPEWRWNLEVYLYDLDKKTETRITNAHYRQVSPKIFGDFIVWRDERDNSQRDIFLYDISTKTEKNISNNSADQWNPDVWGNFVVWTDLRNGTGNLGSYYNNTDIYCYNIDSGETRQITTNSLDQEGPHIFGQFVIWNDLRNGSRTQTGFPINSDVYMYDLDTSMEKRVTYSTANDSGGIVTEGKVIWYSSRDGEGALYMKPLDGVLSQ